MQDSSPKDVAENDNVESEQHAQPVPGTLTRPYAEHANGDLFDEIEMDIFTANGLTEADFSFFDEPSPLYGAARHGNEAMTADDEPKSIEIMETTVSSITNDEDTFINSMGHNESSARNTASLLKEGVNHVASSKYFNL